MEARRALELESVVQRFEAVHDEDSEDEEENSTRRYFEEDLLTSAQIKDQKRMNRRWKMCWKCQKDRPIYGGKLRISTGLHLFICKSCMDAKQNKTEEKP